MEESLSYPVNLLNFFTHTGQYQESCYHSVIPVRTTPAQKMKFSVCQVVLHSHNIILLYWIFCLKNKVYNASLHENA